MVLRTDNGKEYFSTEISNYLKEQRIQHQLTVAYTPQQNGVAERKNRSLTESARYMLLDAGLDKRFWGEAILTAVYLQNRTISRSINKTPLKLFIGEKPDISHIRVFGSKTYSLIPKQRRRKLDNKAEEGILIGYDANTKGYRILNPSTNRVWISRSVKIIEHEDNQVPETCSEKQETVVCGIPESDSEVLTNSEEDNVEYTSDEDYTTPPEETREKRVNKGIPPKRLTYKVQAVSRIEPS